ncbi:hypothetical protein [Piscirickettsia litoralis]|uniref:Uncharacterized protein n=1 Tax=Piscirickettsia litoralis TaxID=1891921 RepID=A0ABX3A6N4_9GAMM|nr:hypothetical protein [Piscirickettsia litoralis]ODN43105.1 hypothetical protein BGC07_09485 [Piscirickettsia litoralis]
MDYKLIYPKKIAGRTLGEVSICRPNVSHFLNFSRENSRSDFYYTVVRELCAFNKQEVMQLDLEDFFNILSLIDQNFSYIFSCKFSGYEDGWLALQDSKAFIETEPASVDKVKNL